MPIKNCACSNAYQDSLYGEQRRVVNACKKEGEFRCTACGRVFLQLSTSKKKKQDKEEAGKK